MGKPPRHSSGQPARERGEQRLRVGVGNRKHGNFRDRLGFLDGEALGVGGRADSRASADRRDRSAVHHAAALHAVARTPAALGIIVAVEIAVILRDRNR